VMACRVLAFAVCILGSTTRHHFVIQSSPKCIVSGLCHFPPGTHCAI